MPARRYPGESSPHPPSPSPRRPARPARDRGGAELLRRAREAADGDPAAEARARYAAIAAVHALALSLARRDATRLDDAITLAHHAAIGELLDAVGAATATLALAQFRELARDPELFDVTLEDLRAGSAALIAARLRAP